MNLNEYDKWVIGNQKKILDWTRKFSKARYAPIRDAFSAYRNAKSNKEKINAFEALKKELKTKSGVSFGELVEKKYNPVKEVLQRAANDHTQGDIEALDRNSNLSDKLTIYDDLSPLSEAITTLPKVVDNYDWVELDKAFEDRYNVNELTALANKYGYDYKDKNERAEFLGKLAEIQNKNDLEKIWNDGTVAGLYTDIITPITKEYAKNNYNKINGTGDLVAPLAADIGVNTMMAGLPGAGVTRVGGPGKIAQRVATVADNTVAPTLRGTANVFINDAEPSDAAKNAVSEIATNFATPWMLRGVTRKANRYAIGNVDEAKRSIVGGTEKEIEKAQKTFAKETINEAADKVAFIQSRLKNGAIFKDDAGNFVKMNKDGSTVRFDGNPYGRDIVSKEDMDFYRTNKGAIRFNSWGPPPVDKYGLGLLDKHGFKNASKQLSENLKPYQVAKIRDNILNGKSPLDGIDVEDLALSVGQKPKETKFNWAARKGSELSNTNMGKAGASYINNLQGKTKWGGSAITTVGNILPPQLSEKIDLKPKKKLDTNDPELELYKRMRDLHELYPDYYPIPTMPAKYNDFKEDITIKNIFGR